MKKFYNFNPNFLIMKKLLYALLTLFLFIGNMNAQKLPCATDDHFRAMAAKDPSLIKDLENLIANGLVEKAGEDDSTIFIIPVVFHVLHQYGNENITDPQIHSAIDVLNRDYRKSNPDTSLVISEYDSLVADIKIEFKLASYDPLGNCTNGIDRIYTHETNNGDNNSKLNQWDRSRYLNVWVVNAINSGAAGYSHYPTAVNGNAYWIDGVLILHNYVGDSGTSSTFVSHALSHEVGHWLSLPHVWGSTNEPGVACGDDGINDTPITKGFNFCPASPNDAIICNTTDSIVENYQNFMEYSYCSHMFTKDQATVMRHALQGNDGLRKNLITAETQQSTGVDLTTPPVCIPTPAINASTRFTCVGENVTFSDESFNGPVTFREWTFQDATPATSTSANPTVTFNSYGIKTVTLKVGNASGEVTKTFEKYIDVQPDWASFTGPQSFNLEPATQYQQLRYLNDGETFSKFVPVNVGYASGRSLKLTNYKNISGALANTQESRYYGMLGGQKDAIITPTFDLRNTTNVTFSFDYSYASNTIQTSLMTEQIQVFYSRNCGLTWTPLGTISQSKITGAELASAGFAGNIDFVPSNDNAWGHFSGNLTATSNDGRTRFKIEFTASDYSSNLFIDNINIGGTLGVAEDFASQHDLMISPNPVTVGSELNIKYVAGNEPVTFILRNLQGQEISKVVRTEKNQPVNFGFSISEKVAASYYFLEVTSASSTTVKKIAITK